MRIQHNLRPPAISILASLILLILIYAKAVDLGLRDFTAPMTSKIHEIVLRNVAIALSNRLYSTQHDYTGLGEIYSSFYSAKFGASPAYQTAKTVDQAIAYFRDAPPLDAKNVFFGWGEDFGLSDYAYLAFAVFGFSLTSLFDLYFVFLFLSVALFVFQFRSWPPALAVPPLVLAALYAALPAYVLSPESSSLFSNRSAPVLGLLPSLHAVLWLLGTNDARKYCVGYLIAQLILIVMVVHARATANWQVLTITLVSLGTFAWHARRFFLSVRQRDKLAMPYRFLLPATFLMTAIVAHSGYMRVAVAPQYKQGGADSHSKWHMLFMGLTLHPRSRDLGWQPDDVGVTRLAQEYFERHHSYYSVRRGWRQWDLDVSPWTTGKWGNYEIVVRDMFIDFAVSHPRFVMRAQMQKAMFMASWVMMGFGLAPPTWLAKTANADISTSILQLEGVRLSPLTLVTALTLVATVLVLGLRQGRSPPIDGLLPIVVSVLALFVGSLLPGTLTAPIPHGMIDVIVCAHAAVLVIVLTLLLGLWNLLGSQRGTRECT